MSIFSKFMNGMNQNPEEKDDNYFLDDDYEDSAEEDAYPQTAAPRSRGTQTASTFQKAGSFLNRKVVPMDNADMEVTMVRPSSMNDSKLICDYLLDGKAVVLNMEGMGSDLAQRIIDFTMGSVYAIDGEIKQISSCIFIASPRNVQLSGDFQGDFNSGFSGNGARMNNRTAYSRGWASGYDG